MLLKIVAPAELELSKITTGEVAVIAAPEASRCSTVIGPSDAVLVAVPVTAALVKTSLVAPTVAGSLRLLSAPSQLVQSWG